MTSLCYPYGGGITCVCDNLGKIFKCFPHLGEEKDTDEQEEDWEMEQHNFFKPELLNGR